MNYNNTYRKTNNAVIKNLYAPGYASLTLSYFKTNLTLRFDPYIGKSNLGRSQYDTKNYVSTTIDNESAAALYSMCMRILQGSATPVQITIPCNHASLIFKYEPDQNHQMRAYIIIEKGNKTIPFLFEIHCYREKVNGQEFPRIIQSGLLVFSKTLETFLISKDYEKPQSQFSESSSEVSQMPFTKW